VVFIEATSINPYKVVNRIEHVVGSGFIFDPAGLVLTNSHVAYGRQSIIVTLDDGTSVAAELVGADPIFDIAVLRIDAPETGPLPSVKLADSNQVRVGDLALAIGNPLGLDQSLTRGTVSAVNRVLPPTFFAFEEPLIQIDTPINPGNSGGPLLNECGEVIGITTAVVPDAQNIGFAIPINLAKAVIPSLLAQGHVVRPWLGFNGQFIDETLQELLRVPLTEGFLVEAIEPGSPAAAAHLRGGTLELSIAGRNFLIGGDVITKINGTALTSPEKILDALKSVQVGSTITLTVYREGAVADVQYVLPERPLLPGDIPESGAAFTSVPAGLRKPTACCVRMPGRTKQPQP
jgi:S1-C subfamily serine protease